MPLDSSTSACGSVSLCTLHIRGRHWTAETENANTPHRLTKAAPPVQETADEIRAR